MSQSLKLTIAVIAALAVAFGAGFLGASVAGGNSAAASSNDGAWLQAVRDRGELRVGVASNPPMTAEQEDGKMGGPNILPLERLAAELGVDLVTVPSEDAGRVPGLLANQFDIVANLDATSERSLSIRFTDPVYTYSGVFAVRADSGLTSTEEIVNAGTVAVSTGTAYEANIEALGVTIQSSENSPKAIAAMKAGRADAAFADLPTLADAAQKDPEIKIVIPESPIYQATANYGVPPTIDAWSLEAINIAINNSISDGSLALAFEAAGVINEDTIGDLRMQ